MGSKCLEIPWGGSFMWLGQCCFQGGILIDCVSVLGWPSQELQCLCTFGFLELASELLQMRHHIVICSFNNDCIRNWNWKGWEFRTVGWPPAEIGFLSSVDNNFVLEARTLAARCWALVVSSSCYFCLLLIIAVLRDEKWILSNDSTHGWPLQHVERDSQSMSRPMRGYYFSWGETIASALWLLLPRVFAAATSPNNRDWAFLSPPDCSRIF